MQKSTIKIIVIAILAMGIGFFGGMEYKAYQIRSAVNDAFSEAFDIFDGDKEDDRVNEATISNKEEESPILAVNDLTNKVGFEVVEKKFIEGNFQDNIAFTFQLTNKTDKSIEGVKGSVIFNDLFGDQIQKVSLSYDEGLAENQSKLYKASIDYNPFMEKDVELRNIDIEKMKYEWEVNTIIYTDGTQESY